jgi:hypothetical protein
MKCVKIEWDVYDQSLPRLVELKDDEVLNDQLKERLEGNSKSKIRNVEWYTPQAQYLIVGVGNIMTQRGFNLALIIELAPKLFDQNIGILHIYPKMQNNEFIYDILRTEFHQFVREENSCLYFEEFITHRGKPISILSLLEGLCKTIETTLEAEDYLTADFQNLIRFWEN